MTDILKEKIIIRAIKVYKNREEWTDDYYYFLKCKASV